MLRTTLMISLPLLAFAACKTNNKDKKDPAVASAEVVPSASQQAAAVANVSAEQSLRVDAVTTGDKKNGGGQNQNQNQNNPTTPVHECETLVIDFQKGSNGGALKFGEEMRDQYASWGVGFVAHKNLRDGRTLHDVKPVLVDVPKTGLAATTDVTDNARGGYVKLTFAKPTSIISMDLIDVENNTSNIELFNLDPNNQYVSKSVQPIPQKGDKETFNLSVDDHSYIRKMTLKFTGSSTVDNIKICIKN